MLQLIYDGHGFTSASGAARFCLRSPHTKRSHNATRNAFDPIFFLGSDKHLYLEKAVAIGGADSLRSHAYAGLKVTTEPAASQPAHVQADTELCDILCTRYVESSFRNPIPTPLQ